MIRKAAKRFPKRSCSGNKLELTLASFTRRAISTIASRCRPRPRPAAAPACVRDRPTVAGHCAMSTPAGRSSSRAQARWASATVKRSPTRNSRSARCADGTDNVCAILARGLASDAVVLVPEGRKQECLVDLGADEAQPFLQAVAIRIAEPRREAALRLAGRRCIAAPPRFRSAVRRSPAPGPAPRPSATTPRKSPSSSATCLGPEMHQMIARIEAGLHQRDAARKRAGHRREIELQHRVAPLFQRIAARDDREAVG